MLKIIIRYVMVVLIFTIFFSCSSPTHVPNEVDYNNSYIPSLVGINKEYIIYQESANIYQDSSRQLYKIAGRVFREDGQPLFIVDSKFIYRDHENNYESRKVTNYQYISDGYLINTTIIKDEDNSNPFWARRVAKAYPEDGEVWYLDPNSSKWEIKAIYIGEMETPAGVFSDVFNFQYIDSTFGSLDTVNSYYAKGVGNIARSRMDFYSVVNYIKVDTEEYGEQLHWY